MTLQVWSAELRHQHRPAELRFLGGCAAHVRSECLKGAGHRANGNRIEAVQNYSRAIELSDTPRAFPTYTHAIRELSALEGKPK